MDLLFPKLDSLTMKSKLFVHEMKKNLTKESIHIVRILVNEKSTHLLK